MVAYKFSKTAQSEKPDTAITRLLEGAMEGKSLNRLEKDTIASTLYGLFGSHGSTYKLMGWAWNMSSCLKRILVSFKYEPGTFNTYYAPDKTSLRGALRQGGTPISEMVEV